MKPHHGQVEILSMEDSTKLLESGHHAHLACHLKEDIYVVPITYAFEDGYIYSHSKLGKKIEMMRKSPKICVQVEEIKDFFHWKSVIAWGQFEELTGEKASTAMRLLIKKVVDNKGVKGASSLEVDFSAQLETAIIFRMKAQKITGRFEESN